MLDIHAVSSGGATTLTKIGTILLGGDGASVAGQPIKPSKAKLVGWGGLTTIADTIMELQLSTLDMDDQKNAEWLDLGASSLMGLIHENTQIPFEKGVRDIYMRQNTGAANNMGYTIDHYDEGGSCVEGSRHPMKKIKVVQIAGAALTALTWLSTPLAPTNALPNGKYALLGAQVSLLTNYGLVRFSHTDFDGYKPGFPVVDLTNATAAVGFQVTNKHDLLLEQGFQFVQMSERLKRPCCPTFEVNGATGLSIELAAITSTTPRCVLTLAKI